jgi:hypothetical protein
MIQRPFVPDTGGVVRGSASGAAPHQSGGYAPTMYFVAGTALNSLASALLAGLRGRIGPGIAPETGEPVGSLVGSVCMSATFPSTGRRSRRPAAL